MTKYSKALWGVPFVVLFLLLQGVSAAQFGAENELLIYKPQPDPSTYTLRVTTHSVLETSSPRSDIAADHEDILTLSQRVRETDDGLLDVVLTVDGINPAPPSRSASGGHYQREDVVGNSQHTVLSLLGEVKEATGLPHFASQDYYGARGIDGMSFDLYRVMLMLYPQLARISTIHYPRPLFRTIPGRLVQYAASPRTDRVCATRGVQGDV